MTRILAVLLLAFLGASPAWAQSSGISVQQPWARATPGGTTNGAVYMTIVNSGASSDQLVAASTPVAGSAQLHEMSMTNGVMQMRPIPALDVAPGATVALAPGGYHIMLLGLKHPLKDGDSFPMTLTFAKSGKQDVVVSVAKVGATQPDSMGAMPGMNGGGTMNSMPGMNMK
ncbi:MAG: copper chaperone PCu(A)C [Stellaceae bacterium]